MGPIIVQPYFNVSKCPRGTQFLFCDQCNEYIIISLIEFTLLLFFSDLLPEKYCFPQTRVSYYIKETILRVSKECHMGRNILHHSFYHVITSKLKTFYFLFSPIIKFKTKFSVTHQYSTKTHSPYIIFSDWAFCFGMAKLNVYKIQLNPIFSKLAQSILMLRLPYSFDISVILYSFRFL